MKSLSLVKITHDENDVPSSARYALVPKYAALDPNNIEAGINELLHTVDQRFSDLVDVSAKLNLGQLLDGLAQLDDELDIHWTSVHHLLNVKSTDELKEVVESIQPRLLEMSLKISQSDKIYDALLRTQNEAETNAELRIVDLYIRSRKVNGIDLDPETLSQFNSIKQEIAATSLNFGNNLTDCQKSWTILIDDRSKLAGIPENYVTMYHENALKEGMDSTEYQGPWLIYGVNSSTSPILQYADDASLRKEVYLGQLDLCGPNYHDLSNVDNIVNLLSLRKREANTLKYSNYGELSCTSKMATVNSAFNLLEDLLEKAMPIAKKEHEDLQAFANSNGFVGDLQHWDINYWVEQMKQSLFKVSSETFRPYFPLDGVLEGLFDTLRYLFDIQVEPFDFPTDVQWDDFTKMFKLVRNEETVAYFIIDPITRAGEKGSGAWFDEVSSRNKFDNDRIPVGNIALNLSPPTSNQPTLLTLSEVSTLFHEMGHALQHMMTQVNDPSVAGIRGIERDVIELPSQFLEKFVFEFKIIQKFARHYETGERPTEELFALINDLRQFRRATFLVRQIRFGLTDLILHTTYDPETSSQSPSDIYKDVFRRTSVLPPHDGDYFLCQFKHIFAGGYSAGYFSYLWAEVMSADAFAAFEEVGLDNQAEVKKMGQKFLNTILALGGSLPPSEVYKLYRGKEASIDALLAEYGLQGK